MAVNIYKIGGNIINDAEALKNFLHDFAKVPGKKILVHGGGKEATEFAKKAGIETKMIDGRRVTDAPTLDMVTMVYAGLINKRIVDLLQQEGCNAVGLTGADGNSIPAEKRNPLPIDFGYVGDITPQDINTDFIFQLLDTGYVPVFCAICRNRKGGLLNCNADSVAGALAIACGKIEPSNLIYCFEKPGVLTDVNDDNSVIPLITFSSFDKLISEGTISGGMIPKVTNALNAVKAGVNSVRICQAQDINNRGGTLIKS